MKTPLGGLLPSLCRKNPPFPFSPIYVIFLKGMERKLIIASDLGRFRALLVEYLPKVSPRVENLVDQEFVDAHRKVLDHVSDQAGRHGGPTGHPGAAPMADDHNLRLETQRRLIKEIAKSTVEQLQAYPDLPCWFAAPREIYKQILEEIPTSLRGRIEKIEPRNVAKLHPHDLVKLFDPEAFKRFHANRQ